MVFVAPTTLTRQANGCELAYSKVQVECDICRACSIQDSPLHPYAPTHLESRRSCFFQTGRPRVSHSVPLVQEAGCEVHAAGKDPFDCEAALNNFFRAPYQEFMFHGFYGIHGIHGIRVMHVIRGIHGIVLNICN